MEHMRVRKAGWTLGLGCLALLACAGPPTVKRPVAQRGPSGAAAASTAAEAALRVLQAGRPLLVQGEVRLISDQGGGIISNNTGALISDQGGGIISNNTGALISDQGGGLISNHGSSFQARLLQAPVRGDAPATPGVEAWLADAVVELLDVQGRPLAGPDGKALRATSDRQGRYRLEALLPPQEAAIARVRLFQGGELRTVVVGEAGATQSQRPLNTAATLGSAYVLDELVKGQQQLLAKLPLGELTALDREAEAARGRLGALVPRYRPDESLSLAKRLKGEDTTFSQRLDRIAAILAAGQANRGAGLPATEVPLSAPLGLLPQADGGFMVVELFNGQLRRVHPDGHLEDLEYAGTGPKPVHVGAVAPTREGGALILEEQTGRLIRMKPDRSTEAVGPGWPEAGAPPLWTGATAVAEGPGGELLLGSRDAKGQASVVELSPQGQVQAWPLPAEVDGLGALGGVATVGGVAKDREGALWVLGLTLMDDQVKGGWMLKREPGGQWTAQSDWLSGRQGDGFTRGQILLERPGGPVACLSSLNALLAPDAQGRWRPLNLEGRPGLNPDGEALAQARFQAPQALGAAADGSVWLVDKGNGLVRRWGQDGRLVDVAGARGVQAVGQALRVGLNLPAAPVPMPDGSLIIPEGGSGYLKRLKDGQLSLYGGNGGPVGPFPGRLEGMGFRDAQAAAYDPQRQALYLSLMWRLLRIDAQGQVESLTSTQPQLVQADPDGRVAKEVWFKSFTGVCLDGEGQVWFASRSDRAVYQITKDGILHRRIGLAPSELNDPVKNLAEGDGPGTGTPLGFPIGLAKAPDGRIFVADALRFRVRALDPKTGLCRAVAGMSLTEATLDGSLSRSQEEIEWDPDGVEALRAHLMGPVALAFDPQGNLYVSEAGTGLPARLSGVVPDLNIAIPEIPPLIRKLTPEGRLYHIAGHLGRVLKGLKGDEALGFPSGLAVDGQGRLVIADVVRNQLRFVPPEALATP